MSLVEIGTLTLYEIVGDFGYQYFANNGGIVSFAVGTTDGLAEGLCVVYYLIKSLVIQHN